MRVTQIVGVIVDVRIIAPVPARTVDIVVVGVVVHLGTGCADKRIVRRHGPGECRAHVRGAEPQVLRRTVDFAKLH